ncbi:Protein of unknown function [Gryllus bimaculatus]|nr:Protein of unknown function [Gryllus bimaculatus]
MAVSRPQLHNKGYVPNIFGSQGYRANRIARHIVKFETSLHYSDPLHRINRYIRGFAYQLETFPEAIQQIQSKKEVENLKEMAKDKWDEGALRQRASEGVGAEQMQPIQSEKEAMSLKEMDQWDEGALRQRASERVGAERLQRGPVKRGVPEGKERGRPQKKRNRHLIDYEDDLDALKLLMFCHQSFRGVIMRENDAGSRWRGIAYDPPTGKKRLYRWKSGGAGDEGGRAAAALLAARSLGSTDVDVRAAALWDISFSNYRLRYGGIEMRIVGNSILLLEEMKKRLRMNVSVSFQRNFGADSGHTTFDILEKLLVQGKFELVPQYSIYKATHLIDIVSSGEYGRYIVLVPYASLPAWSLPLRVFSAIGRAGWTGWRNALAWRCGGASRGVQAAARLSAFPRARRAQQDRVRARAALH